MRRPLPAMTTALVLLVSGAASAQDGTEPAAAGAFESAGELTLARSGHTATLLPDGRVLVTGGDDLDPEDLGIAEVWDPATAAFGPSDRLAEPVDEPPVDGVPERTGHSATLLPDGRGLIIGGSNDDGLVGEAGLIDPLSGTLSPAGTLAVPRSGHTATFLRDGRVLVVGGTGSDGPLASAELWTPAAQPADCLGKRPTLFARPGIEFAGTAGNDVIAGSVGPDIIAGGGGHDRICGYGDDDTIDGGGGNDTIDGGLGSDVIRGAGGKDRLIGAAGDDVLDGGGGKDVCTGGQGTDWLPGCNDKMRTRGTIVVNKNLKLKGPHKGRFIIGRDGVTLDCDGHTVTGAGRRSHIPGVVLIGRKGVTVRNCDMSNHGGGFYLERSRGNRILDNRVSGSGDGFNLQRSDMNTLARNRVTGADDWWGFLVADGSDQNRLLDNSATDTTGDGFAIGTGTKIVKGNVLTGNVAMDGTAAGFTLKENTRGNVLTGNQAVGNGFEGIEDLTTGFRGDAGTDNTYVDNVCRGNRAGTSNPASLCE